MRFAVFIAVLFQGCGGSGVVDLASTPPSTVASTPPSTVASTVTFTAVVSTPASTTFIYRVASGSDRIHRASINLTTGALSEHGFTAVTNGDQPVSLAASPDGRFLFVANHGAKTVATYSLDPVTGAPTFVSSHPTTDAPLKLLMDPLGRFVFGLEYSFIITYTVNSSGTLAWQGVTSISSGGLALAIDSLGKFLYKSSTTTGIQSYDIHPTTGLLSNPGTLNGLAANAIKVNSSTSRFYGPAFGTSNILNFSVNSSTGALTFATFVSTPVSFPFYDLEFDAAGTHLYLLNHYEGLIQAYTVNVGTGALTLLDSEALPSGCLPKSLRLVASASFLFTGCTDGSGKTIGYRIESDGSLGISQTSTVSGLSTDAILSVTF